MENKIHRIANMNDIGNLITDENKELVINDLVHSIMLAVSLKEHIKSKTGEYPTDFFEHVDIILDGKNEINHVTINGETFEIPKT
jgi:hypothetical protein